MSYSDSEDSFHSAENSTEDLRQRDRDVDNEQEEHVEDPPSPTTSTPIATQTPVENSMDNLSCSDRIESALDLDALLDTENIAQQVMRTEDVEIRKFDPVLPIQHPIIEISSQMSRQLRPMNVETDESLLMDDSFVRQSSLSLPDSPSEPSTDKESGNEMKEWDRLSGNSIEAPPTEPVQSSTSVDQNLLDEWEKGWDDTDLTEEEIAESLSKTSLPLAVGSDTDLTEEEIAESFSKTSLPLAVGPPPLTENQPVQASQPSASQTSWGKWGGWGTSLLTTAVGQVGHGLTAVMETVEQSLGAPKPEELAAMNAATLAVEIAAEEGKIDASSTAESAESLTGWLSDLTTKVQSSGLTLVSNSLDVLEGLGKKTMDVVNDKDPGFKQTKAVLRGKVNQPILSQVLREAKTTSLDSDSSFGKSSRKSEEQVSFVHYFDQEQGTGSWEALELLSSQCAQRLQTRESAVVDGSQEEIIQKLEEFCQSSDYEDSPREQSVIDAIRGEYSQLNIGLPEPHALLHVFRKAEEFLSDNSKAPDMDLDLWRRNVHQSGVRAFAACTAKSLEQIRKMAEMIFLGGTGGKQDERLLLRRVESVHTIVCSICLQLDKLANQYAACLTLGGAADSTSSKKPASSTSQITDMFVEASNSNRYIQDALGLCLPIFKLALQNGVRSTGKRLD